MKLFVVSFFAHLFLKLFYNFILAQMSCFFFDFKLSVTKFAIKQSLWASILLMGMTVTSFYDLITLLAKSIRIYAFLKVKLDILNALDNLSAI